MRRSDDPPEWLACLIAENESQLRDCAIEAIAPYRKKSARNAKKKRKETIAPETLKEYIARALTETEAEWRAGDVDPARLLELLRTAIRSLVERDQAKFREIVETTNWSAETKRVVSILAKRYRIDAVDHHGKCLQDYVREAVDLFVEGTRFFPYFRTSLVAFLVQTTRGLMSHSEEVMDKEGSHVALTSKKSEKGRGLTYGDDLASAQACREQEIIAKEKLRRYMATLSPRARRYVRLRITTTLKTADEFARAMGLTTHQIYKIRRELKIDEWNACWTEPAA